MDRTGDLARWREDGNLEFLGRTDDQVKIRGFRIELREIEAVLREQALVEEAVVTVREDRPGERRLVGYVVGEWGRRLDGSILRKRLNEKLPEYMVPAAVMVLERIPLTSNGKVDRKALPAPEFSGRGEYCGARNRKEEVLCRLFGEVLGVERVGVDDNFFEIGGDSILSIQLVSRARKEGLIITPRDVFQYGNVEGLAEAARSQEETKVSAIDRAEGFVPLTPIMKWLQEQGGSIKSFHQSRLLQVPGGDEEKRLKAALQVVLDYHDALRLRVNRSGKGDWGLEIGAAGSVSAEACFRRISVVGWDERRLSLSMAEEQIAAGERLDPKAGVMVQTVWFDAGEKCAGRWMLVVHHLAVDGVSWRILEPDLRAAWEAIREGRMVELGPKGTSFRRWAERLNEEAENPEREKELEYWKGILRQTKKIQLLAGRREKEETLGHLSLALSSGTSGALLTKVSAAFHGQINDILLTALAVAMIKWLRKRGEHESAVVVDLEGHGREEIFREIDVSRTVGWFTTLYPVRLDLGSLEVEEAWMGGSALGRAAKVIKEQLRSVPQKGIGYGLLRYLNGKTGKELAEYEAPQIGFNYLGRFDAPESDDWAAAREGGVVGGGGNGEMGLAHSIKVNAATRNLVDGPRLEAQWTWARSAATEADVQELAQGWFHVLEALVRHTAEPGAGGRTPSDLKFITLTQEEIEYLEGGASDD